MDEVLRRHRYLLGLQVRNDRRARSSSAARLKPDRTPERCSRGLRRAPLPGAYAYRYRHRLDEVCVSDRQPFWFLGDATNPSASIASSIASREKLWGGDLFGPITPVRSTNHETFSRLGLENVDAHALSPSDLTSPLNAADVSDAARADGGPS